MLVLGLLRYGRDILRASIDLIRSLLGGLFIARPDKKAKDEEPEPARASSAVRLLRQPL